MRAKHIERVAGAKKSSRARIATHRGACRPALSGKLRREEGRVGRVHGRREEARGSWTRRTEELGYNVKCQLRMLQGELRSKTSVLAPSWALRTCSASEKQGDRDAK